MKQIGFHSPPVRDLFCCKKTGTKKKERNRKPADDLLKRMRKCRGKLLKRRDMDRDHKKRRN